MENKTKKPANNRVFPHVIKLEDFPFVFQVKETGKKYITKATKNKGIVTNKLEGY